MSLMKEDEFIEHLYGRLPEIYRVEDSILKNPLKKYLTVLADKGYNLVIKETNDLLNLVDPAKCPNEFFPYLYESFGLTYQEDIDIIYQRKFLSDVGNLMIRKGTNASVRYLAKTLTGVEVELSYERGNYLNVYGRYLYVTLLVNTISQIANMNTDRAVVERFLQDQVPFYITTILNARIQSTTFDMIQHQKGFMSMSKSYVLK